MNPKGQDLKPLEAKKLKASLRPLVGIEQCSIGGCPVCGGPLIEIRAKFHCQNCHRICETCCEGGRG